MKIGIIIIFHNNENNINVGVFKKQLQEAKHLELCLVNNNSKDHTYELLKEIKDGCSNVSVVNIKKTKSEVSAIRAGARYMFSQFDLKHIGYACTNLINIKLHGLDGLIKAITENEDAILNYNIKTLERQEISLTLFQSLFSVIEYLKKTKTKSQFLNLQNLNQL